MSWVSVDGVEDHALRAHAVNRGLVRLKSGRIATLVAWPGRGMRMKRGRYCRLETRAGTRFSVRCETVEAYEVPE